MWLCEHLAPELSSGKMGITLRRSVSPGNPLCESSDTSSTNDVAHIKESKGIHHRELVEVAHWLLFICLIMSICIHLHTLQMMMWKPMHLNAVLKAGQSHLRCILTALTSMNKSYKCFLSRNCLQLCTCECFLVFLVFCYSKEKESSLKAAYFKL